MCRSGSQNLVDNMVSYFAVECRTRNQVSPGSNTPFATISKIVHFRSLRGHPIILSCINGYLAKDSGGNVGE